MLDDLLGPAAGYVNEKTDIPSKMSLFKNPYRLFALWLHKSSFVGLPELTHFSCKEFFQFRIISVRTGLVSIFGYPNLRKLSFFVLLIAQTHDRNMHPANTVSYLPSWNAFFTRRKFETRIHNR